MIPRNLSDLLAERAGLYGRRIFMIHPSSNRRYSFHDMEAMANRAGNLLRKRGVQEGDRIMMALPNVPEFFHFLFGAARIGAVAVPVDPQLKAEEMGHLIHHCRPAVLLGEEGIRSKLDSPSDVGSRLSSGGLPVLEVDGRCDERLLSESPELVPGAAGPDRPILILYTSGTTGQPKGVVHTHASILVKLEALRVRFAFDQAFRSLCLLPVCFGHALISNCLSALYCGGTLVLCPTFSLENVSGLWPLIKRFEVNAFSTVPSVLRILVRMRHLFESPAAPLRFVSCASAPLPADLSRDFEQSFGVPVLNCYGIAETASWIASQEILPSQRRPGSVGRPLGCEMRILNERGGRAEAGTSGEITVRGPSLMQGYYERPDLTAEALKEGWFHTGDIGRMDAEGHIFLEGRLKEVINRGGLKVHPDEIDEILSRHPAVSEAATLGVADPLLGEKVASFVALKPGERATPAELIAHCRRYLADYKCPENIHLLDALPRNSRGKIRKRELPIP